MTFRKIFIQKPVFKDWAKTIFKTVCYLTILYYLFMLIGSFGIVGLIIIILGIAIWRIKRSWKFYLYVVDWIVGRLKGRNVKFNFDGGIRNDKNKYEKEKR